MPQFASDKRALYNAKEKTGSMISIITDPVFELEKTGSDSESNA